MSFLIQTDLLIGSIFNWSVQSAAINRRVSLLRSIRERHERRVHSNLNVRTNIIHVYYSLDSNRRKRPYSRKILNHPKFVSRQTCLLIPRLIPPPFLFFDSSILHNRSFPMALERRRRGSIEGGPFFHAGNNLQRENEV